MVEWVGPARNKKCPEFESWTLCVEGGQLARLPRTGSDKKGVDFRIWWQTDIQVICTIDRYPETEKSTEFNLGLKNAKAVLVSMDCNN